MISRTTSDFFESNKTKELELKKESDEQKGEDNEINNAKISSLSSRLQHRTTLDIVTENKPKEEERNLVNSKGKNIR